ncbi:uncharacterized protein [Watersipora subatra]|uniref:uncharacterized protein n=1 Tax=Watersipora subatra TaxID=2589382 RepID=UPI00355C2B7A
MERPSLSSANIRTSLTSSEHTNQNFAFQAQVRGLAPRVASNTNAIHSNSVLKHESVTQALVTNQNNSDGKGENAMVDALNRMKNTPNSLMASMMGKEGNIDQSAMNRMIASAMKNDPVVVQGLIGKMASGTMDPKDMTNAVTQIMQAAIGNRSMTMPTNPTVHQQLDNSMMGSSRLASPRNVRPMMKPSIPPNMPFNRPPIRQAMLGEKFMNRAPIASNQFTRGPVNSHIRAHKVPINTGVPHKSPWVGDESDAWQTQGPPSKKIKTDNPIAESTLVSPVGSSKPASQVPAAHHVTPERNNLLFMDQLRKAKRGGMDVRNMLIFCEVCDDVWGEKAHPVNDYVTHHVSSPDHCKGLIGWLDVHPNKRYQEMLTVPPHKPRCDAKKSAPLKEKLKYAYFCEVCEVPAGYCKKVYFQHMKLKSHLDKMVSLINTIKPQPSGAKKVEELKDAEYLLVPQRLPDLTREKNRLKRFPCQICSVAANDVGELTFDNWLGHMTTQFHMSILYDWLARCKAVAAVPYQKVMMFKGHTVAEKKDPHYFCEICLKRVKHEDEQYKRHLQSSKHLKNSKALTDEVNKALSGGPVTRILEEEKKSIDVYYDDIDEEWLHPHAQAHRETQQETAIETRRLAVENEMKQQITREAHPKTLPQNTTSEGTPPRSIAQQAVGTPSNVGQNRMQLKNSTRSEGPILRHIPPNASTPDLIRQPMPRVQNPHRLPGPRSEQLRMPPPRIAGQNFPRQRQMEAPSSDHKLQNPSLGHGTNAQTGGPSRMRMPPPVGFPNFENPRHPMPQNMPRNPLRNIPPRDQMIPPNLRPNNPRASMSRGQMPTPNMNRMPLPNIRHPPPQPNVVPPAHARPQPNIPPRPFGPRTISPRPIKVEGLEESPLDVPLVGPERLPMAHQRFIRPRLNAPTLPNRMNRPQAPRLLPPRSVVPQDGQEYFPDMPPQSPDAIEGRRIASQNIRMQGPNNMGPPRNRTAAPMQQLRGQAPTGTRGPMPFRPRGPLPVMDRPPLGMPHPIRNMRPRAMLHESAQNDAHFNEDVFEKNTFRTQNEPDSRFKSKEDQETLKNPTVAQDKWMEASERFVQQASQGLPIATKSSGCVDHQEKNASGHSLQSVMDIKFDSRPPAKTTPEHMHFHSSLEPHQHSTSHSELRVSTETDRFQQKRNDAPLSSAHERDILQEQRQLIKNALNSVKANDAMLKASEGRDGKPVQLMRSHNADLDRNSYSPNGLISQVPFSNEASLEPKLSPPFPRSQASKALLPTPGKLALLPTPAVSVATNNVFIQRERGPDDYLLFPDKLTKLAILPAFPLNDAYCELCPQIPAFSDIVEWVEHVSTLPHMMTLFRIAETRRGPLAHHLCGKVVIPPHGPQNNYYICEVCCILNTENNMIDHLSARKHLINLKNLAVTMRDSCAWMREFLISSKKEFWNRAPPSEGKSGAGVMTNTSKPEYDVETGSSTSNLFDFQDPQMAFLHSVLTGVVALTTFKDMKEEGGDIPVDLEAKIGREQRVIVEKMCTKSGHLVISIARRVIEKERKEKILEYYPEVKPQFVDIVTGLQPDILKLIADTPILDRPPS